jgi:hypothetical protein
MLAGNVVGLAQFQSAGSCSVLTDDREHARAGTGGTPRTLNLQRKQVTPAVRPLKPLMQPNSQLSALKKPRPQ